MNRKLLGILALALLVRVVTFCGYAGTPDEIVNVDIVNQILHGTWPTYDDEEHITEMIMPVRIGFVGTVALLVKLFGFSDLSVVLYPLCASFLAVPVIFLLGRRWIGEEGGLWAAFLLAVFPLDVIFSTKLYSESILMFLGALSVLLFFRAEDELPERRRAVFALLSGLVIGFAYLHKVTAAYFCILFALIGLAHMARDRKIHARYLFLLLGFAVVFGFEMCFQYFLHNDPLYPWHVYARQGASLKMIAGLRGEVARSLPGALKRLFWTFPFNSLVSFRLGAFYWFIFPAVLYCLVRKPRKLWAPLLWWGFVMPFTVLTTYFGGLPHISRQTVIYTVPGLLLLAAVLAESRGWTGLESRAARKGLLALLAALVLLSLSAALSLWVFQPRIVKLLARLYLAKTVFPMGAEVVEWALELFLKYVRWAGLALALFFAAVGAVAWRREKRGNPSWPGRLLAPLIAGFLAITSVALAYSENKGFPYSEKDAFRALAKLPPRKIYADWYTKQILDFHFGFPAEERVVEFGDVELETVRDAYLVYNSFRKNMASRLDRLASEITVFQQFDRYVQSYEKVDAARSGDWKQIEAINRGLITLYYLP